MLRLLAAAENAARHPGRPFCAARLSRAAL